MRRAKHWEQGSQAPVVHVTGTEENELRIKVHFRETLLDPAVQGNSLARMDLIDSIRLAARPLRIVWGKVLRRGMLLEFTPGIESAGEIPAELVFEIYDHGHNVRGTRRHAKPPPVGSGIDALSDFVNAALSNIPGALVTVPGLTTDFTAQLSTLTSAVLSPLTSLLALGEDLKAGISDLKQSLSSIANQARSVIQRSKELYSFLNSTSDPVQGDFADVRARWQRMRADALVALNQVVAQAFKVGQAAESLSQGSTVGRVYTVRGVETLEQIARREGVTVEQLLALNPTVPKGGLVRAPQKIKMP